MMLWKYLRLVVVDTILIAYVGLPFALVASHDTLDTR
jgi:hypothetical protein